MIFKTEKDREQAYKNLFSSVQGKMVLVDVLDALHFWDTVMPPNLTEVELNAFNMCAKKILARGGFWDSEHIVGSMARPKKKRWWKRNG